MTEPGQPPPINSDLPYTADTVELPRKSGISTCLIGCLITFGIFSMLCAGAGFYTYYNFRKFAGSLAREAMVQTIESSELPAEEKTAIIVQIERVVEAYENNEISNQELGEILQDLAESPLIGLIMVQAVEANYVIPSGLSPKQKSAARRTIMRVLRGAIEETIEKNKIESLSEHFMTGVEGNRQLKQRLSDTELRAFLAAAKEMVDVAEVPDEDFELRFSDRIREIVDKALGADADR